MMNEAQIRDAVTAGGGVYRGLQSGFGLVPDQVLFDDPQHNTLCLEPSRITPEAVAVKIEAKRLEYGLPNH